MISEADNIDALHRQVAELRADAAELRTKLFNIRELVIRQVVYCGCGRPATRAQYIPSENFKMSICQSPVCRELYWPYDAQVLPEPVDNQISNELIKLLEITENDCGF